MPKPASLLLLALLLLPLLAAAARPPLRKDLRRDFGALGDGRTDDQAAFHRAADFFNRRAGTPQGRRAAVLRIPAGTYRVGHPGPGSMDDLLHLRNCRNLQVLGDDSATTEIRYADSLRYGAFDPATHLPYEAPTAFFTEGRYALGLGTAITLQGCDNVRVARLRLNGNSPHLVVGGHWGDTGIQLAADGIFVSSSRRVRVQRVAGCYFGRDGIQVLNHQAKALDDPARQGIVLTGSRFDYNGRQGLSITGANGLQATGCSFSHTGRVLVAATGRPLYSNPGAGVDVEPEGSPVAQVLLAGCRLVDNAGQGLVSDRYGSGPPTTRHIVVRRCLLWGTTNWSAWVRQTDFRFEGCRFYGAFITGCALAAYATEFVGCTFADRPYHGQPAYGPYLLYSRQEARAMRFIHCRFEATHGALLLATPAAPDSASRFRLHGCTFVANQPYQASAPPEAAGQVAGAVFSGATTWQAGPQRPDTLHSEVRLGGPESAGPTTVLPGGRLVLRAPGTRYACPTGLALRGTARVVWGAGCELVLGRLPSPAPALYLAPGARLLVQKGGILTISAGARVVLAGRVQVAAGAHLALHPLATVALVGRGRLGVSRARRAEAAK